MAIAPQVFTFPLIASNASTTVISAPGVFTKVYLQVPTMAAGYTIASTPIYIKLSTDGGTTYARYTNPELNTFPVGSNDFTIASSVSNRVVLLPELGFATNIQVELSANASGGAAGFGQFKLITAIE